MLQAADMLLGFIKLCLQASIAATKQVPLTPEDMCLLCVSEGRAGTACLSNQKQLACRIALQEHVRCVYPVLHIQACAHVSLLLRSITHDFCN